VSVGSIGGANTAATAPVLPRAKSAPAAASVLTSLSTQHTAASLEEQIRAAREQLNDWVTCVSATTPKGQAEIRSLSAQISAAQQRIDRLHPTDSAALDVWA
jgi:hypothetical protein